MIGFKLDFLILNKTSMLLNKAYFIDSFLKKVQKAEALTINSARVFLLLLIEIIDPRDYWWDTPLINVSEDLEIVLEWYHIGKKITIYIKDKNISYLKIWGKNIETEMEDGEIKEREDIQNLWEWLIGVPKYPTSFY